MSSREATAPNREQTITRARTARAEQAMAAALYANRVEQARAAARHRAMARWTTDIDGRRQGVGGSARSFAARARTRTKAKASARRHDQVGIIDR